MTREWYDTRKKDSISTLSRNFTSTISFISVQEHTCFCIWASVRPTMANLDTIEAVRRPRIIPIPRAGRRRREPRIRWEIKLGLLITDGKEQLNGSQTHNCSDLQHLVSQNSHIRGLQVSDVSDPAILLVTRTRSRLLGWVLTFRVELNTVRKRWLMLIYAKFDEHEHLCSIGLFCLNEENVNTHPGYLHCEGIL